MAAVGLGIGLGLAGGPPARAADSTQVLLQRLERMEGDLNTLQRYVYRGNAPAATATPTGTGAAGASQSLPADVAGRLQVRMGELERLVQDLTGRVEESQFQTQRLSQRLDQLISDVDFRLSRLEQGGGGAVSAPDAAAGMTMAEGAAGDATVLPPSSQAPSEPPQAPGVLGYMRSDGSAAPAPGLLRPEAAAPSGGLAALPEGTPEDQYRYAFSKLRTRDFVAAEQLLTAFLKAHPDHDLAGNAQYWLGETYYARGDMEKAAVAFLDGYKTYPKSSKGPDNLLKLGMTVGQLGQKEQACAALSKLAVEYPQAPDSIKRYAVAERQKLGCG
jgi:tol-pal system protein YbgF